MDTRDRVEDSFLPGEQPAERAGASGRADVDRFEPGRPWVEQSEGEQARAGAALYAQALQNRRRPDAPDPLAQADSEALEARSQELKLRQKCQEIAARVMVDDLLEGEPEDEEE